MSELIKKFQVALSELTERQWQIYQDDDDIVAETSIIIDGQLSRLWVPLSDVLSYDNFDYILGRVIKEAADIIGKIAVGVGNRYVVVND